MKAFVVAALLVSVSSFDLMDLTNGRSLFKPNHKLSTVEELEKLGNHQMMGYNKNFDMDRVYRGQQINILSIEELISFPLFKEYMQLPLFVQLWEQHPVAFKRYVESPLFQQFWQVPEFITYFKYPSYFNQYIIPQVQMISQSVYPSTEGIYTTPRYTPFVYNKYQPVYNREYSTYGQNVYSGLNYKYLLEKMYNHLNMNTMKVGQDVTQTFTDVKTGQVQEQTVGKIIDPITGEEKITVGDVKIVDEKMIPFDTVNFPKYQMDKIFGHHNTETIKDVLLKHIILNKIFGEKKTFTPEVYQTLFDKEIMTPEIVPEMLETTDLYNNNDYYKYKMEEPLFTMKSKMFNPLVSRMLKNKKIDQFNMKNKMIQKFQAEKMIEKIQKEKIMKLIKDTEIPKMMETEKYQHIPLTYVKPNFGSTLFNQFTEEKEIKNLY